MSGHNVLLLLLAAKAPDRAARMLALSDPAAGAGRTEALRAIQSLTPAEIEQRLEEAAGEQNRRFEQWTRARFGAEWHRFPPRFRRHLAMEWCDHDRPNPAKPSEPTDPQTGSV